MRALKNRSGSTLVMVAILLVAFLGVGAIAADIGRFYVVTGELQTAADAAALKGAATLQVTGGTNPEATVDADVVAFVGATNRADNNGLTVTPAAVEMAFWKPGATAPVVPVPAGTRPNAVRVTLGRTSTGVFSQLIGNTTGLSLARSATAWVGNLGNCVKPWALPYLSLYKSVTPGSAAATDPAPDLDPAQFYDFQQRDSLTRMFTYIGPPKNNDPVPPVNDGRWFGFSYAGNSGKPGFEQGIATCAGYVSADAANGSTLPGSGGQYNGWATGPITTSTTVNGTSYPPICVFKSNTDAGCYSSATAASPGVVINAAWGDALATGSNTIVFRYVGQFSLKCYYRGNANESCPLAKNGNPGKGYSEGSFVGYVMGLKSRIITADDVIGNTPSNQQRLFLVK